MMKKVFLMATIVATAMSLSSCCSTSEEKICDNPEAAEVKIDNAQLNGEWIINSVESTAIATAEGQEVPFFNFNIAENQFNGYAGCNRIFGSLNIAASASDTLSFGAAGATKMMCPDIQIEDKVLAAMPKVKAAKMNAEQLVLVDENGAEIFVLSAKK